MSRSLMSENQPLGFCHRLRRTITAPRRFVARLLPGPRAWCGATIGVIALTVAVWLYMSINAFAPTGPWAFILGWLGGLLACALLGGLLVLIGALLRGVPRAYGWAFLGALPLLLLSYLLGISLAFGAIAVALGVLVVGSLVGGGIAALTGGGWARLTGVQRSVALMGLGIGVVGLVAGGALLLIDGFSLTPPLNAAMQSRANVTPLDLPDPSRPGPYTVQTLTYGSGHDRHRPEYAGDAVLRTTSVDGSALLEGWSDLRRAYWGFGPEALPLNGRIWFPEGDGPFPLILIVHGNHPMEDFSDTGYAYLGELFASRGFIVASVDQNFLNLSLTADVLFFAGLENENDTRGWLLLEHLRQWQTWHTTPGNPFHGKVALDAIGLIGHSRGGEAVAIAAAFSRLPFHPDNATVTFGYDFEIRAIAAVAPVDGQYLPGDRRLPVEDVNYLVIHGVHDMDVVMFSGQKLYQRLAFSGERSYFKAAFYIYGANHGQFNTGWGRHDVFPPSIQLFNLRALMPASDQEQIARVTLSAFMEAALRGEDGYRALFRDPRTAVAWLPDTVYLSQIQDSATLRVATYDEDIDLSTTTLSGGTLQGERLALWREQIVPLKQGDMDNTAVYLGWDRAPDDQASRYTIALPELDLRLGPESMLSFSLADADERPTPTSPRPAEPREPFDLTVEVRDGAGQTARLPLSHFSLLQPQIRGRYGKAAFMHVLPLSEPVFQTFEFRLGDFAADNAAFDPASLREVHLVFDRSPSGVVILDEVGLRAHE